MGHVLFFLSNESTLLSSVSLKTVRNGPYYSFKALSLDGNKTHRPTIVAAYNSPEQPPFSSSEKYSIHYTSNLISVCKIPRILDGRRFQLFGNNAPLVALKLFAG